MRLYKHINEQKELSKNALESMNSLIQRSCKPYLNLIKGKTPMYRGMDWYRDHDFGKKNVRKVI